MSEAYVCISVYYIVQPLDYSEKITIDIFI